ncbi:MAG: helix-turn-helix transcriptional regulator [Tissierellales bacterium]|nr:helix-turn-helix transcriptional regulator [Tissierellales bacterium]MBN2827371.1 helix-turn-helix transcriptional regulator [Tissierellales bacterium]
MLVGSRLKKIRKSKSLTLKQLSKLTGLSIGFLSNLERQSTSPTLEQLQQICLALEINMMDLLESTQNENFVVKKSDRKKIYNNDAKVCYETLTQGERKLGGVCMTISNNAGYADNAMWQHSFDEIGIVISGEMVLIVDEVEHLLQEGDAIYISAHTPHKYYNPKDENCVSYWVFQHPASSFIEQKRL